MNFLTSIFLGLVQGLAEFLPISSSGHLSLFQNFFGLTDAGMFFDVLLHLGTLIAIFVYYWKDIKGMILEFFEMCKEIGGKRSSRPAPEAMSLRRMKLYGNTWFIGLALIATGCLLYFSDRMARGKKGVNTTKITDALIIGCGQAVATVPGLSRSGTTIATAMLLGVDRKFAVRYSFLLSLPAVIGANLLELIKAFKLGIEWGLMPVYAVGVCVAAMSGYWAIGVVKRLTDQGKFGRFAYYCWGVGALAIVLSAAFAIVNR